MDWVNVCVVCVSHFVLASSLLEQLPQNVGHLALVPVAKEGMVCLYRQGARLMLVESFRGASDGPLRGQDIAQ